MALSAKHPGEFYIAMESLGLLHTMDDLQTYDIPYIARNGEEIRAVGLSGDEERVFFISSEGHLYRYTVSDGTVDEIVLTEGYMMCPPHIVTGDTTIAIVFSRHVYVSYDDGATWADAGEYNDPLIALDTRDNTTLYILDDEAFRVCTSGTDGFDIRAYALSQPIVAPMDIAQDPENTRVCSAIKMPYMCLPEWCGKGSINTLPILAMSSMICCLIYALIPEKHRILRTDVWISYRSLDQSHTRIGITIGSRKAMGTIWRISG